MAIFPFFWYHFDVPFGTMIDLVAFFLSFIRSILLLVTVVPKPSSNSDTTAVLRIYKHQETSLIAHSQ